MLELTKATLLYPLIGGIILSASVSLNLWLKGRITGVSSIITGIWTWDSDSLKWKSSFLAGLVIASVMLYDLFGFESSGPFVLDKPEEYVNGLHLFGWLIAGFCVGYGTRLGNGCTSGHGLCGIPRLSKRSIVAVCIFMGVAVVVATIRDYYPFLTEPIWVDVAAGVNVNVMANVFLVGAVGVLVLNLIFNDFGIIGQTDVFVSAGTGILFACGLLLSGMARRSVVLGFLTLNEKWNPALLFVFAGALGCNFLSFHFILKGHPKLAIKFDLPSKTELDTDLVVGAVVFGLGWGLAGLCPAPALIGMLFYFPHVVLFFITTFVLGQYVAGLIKKEESKGTYEIIKDTE